MGTPNTEMVGSFPKRYGVSSINSLSRTLGEDRLGPKLLFSDRAFICRLLSYLRLAGFIGSWSKEEKRVDARHEDGLSRVEASRRTNSIWAVVLGCTLFSVWTRWPNRTGLWSKEPVLNFAAGEVGADASPDVFGRHR
jgi:hypothetical protein